MKKVTSVDTGIGFTPLLLTGLQAAMALCLLRRMKSHIKIAFGAVQTDGKRQLYLDSCLTRPLGFTMTLPLLTSLNATGALLCASQDTALDFRNMGGSQRPCAQDRPDLLRYHGSKARAKELKSTEECSKYTHISILTQLSQTMPISEAQAHPSHPISGTVPLAEQAAMTRMVWLGDSATKRTASLSPHVTAQGSPQAAPKLS